MFYPENDVALEKVIQQYSEISILENYKNQLDKALSNLMYVQNSFFNQEVD